jgi:hypothetical protein
MHRPFAIVHVATGRPFDNYTISLLVFIRPKLLALVKALDSMADVHCN